MSPFPTPSQSADVERVYDSRRLPDPRSAKGGPGFGYRLQALTDMETVRYLRRSVLPALLLYPLAVALLFEACRFVPYVTAFVGVFALMAGFAVVAPTKPGRGPRKALQRFAIPTLISGAVEGIHLYMSESPSGTFLFHQSALGVVAFMLFVLLLSPYGIGRFGWSWAAAHPFISSKERNDMESGRGFLIDALAYCGRRVPSPYGYLLFLAVFSFIVGISALSILALVYGEAPDQPSWVLTASRIAYALGALLLLATASGVVVSWHHERRWNGGLTLLAHFLTAEPRGVTAPGLWYPKTSRAARRLLLLLFVVTGSLAFFGSAHARAIRADALITNAATARGESAPDPLFSGEDALLTWGKAVSLLALSGFPLLSLLALLSTPDTARPKSAGLATLNPSTYEGFSPPASRWDFTTERLQGSTRHLEQSLEEGHSPNPHAPRINEADHLFLGVAPSTRAPILLDHRLLREHAYIVGDSGSGKTSLGILPLTVQLLRRSREEKEPSAFLFLDLKGDNGLFQAVRGNAGAQKFLFFTPEEGIASHGFNPFPDLTQQRRSISSFCTLMLDALSLNHGEGYGRGYYTARSRAFLYNLLKSANPQTFEELYALIAQPKKGKAHLDEFELVAVLQMLADYKNLQVLPSPASGLPEPEAIHMRRLIDNGEIAYFWLPAAVESIAVREIGKLALYSVLSAAMARQKDRARPRTVYVVIDEFQRIASENFSILLEQARSFGVSLILANQTLSDLNTPSKDLRPTVRTNTRVKFYFSVADPQELKALSELSGEIISARKSEGVSVGSGADSEARKTTTLTEIRLPRLSVEQLQQHSDHPQEFILHVARGSGLSQFGGLPTPVRADWIMDKKDYDRVESLPWPSSPLPAVPSAPLSSPSGATPSPAPSPQKPARSIAQREAAHLAEIRAKYGSRLEEELDEANFPEWRTRPPGQP